MNKKKLSMTVGSLALVGAIAVGATLAYLTADSGPVKNTFSLSDNVRLVLDEKNVDGNNPLRDTENSYTDIVPDVLYDKDPTVTLLNTDLKQYVFVALKENANIDINDFETAHWELVSTVKDDEQEDVKIYVYYKTVDSNKVYTVDSTDDVRTQEEETSGGYTAGIQLAPLFTKVELADGVEADNTVTNLGNILIAAAATQAEGFNDYNAALSAVETQLIKIINDNN